jgi:hypothetical protein
MRQLPTVATLFLVLTAAALAAGAAADKPAPPVRIVPQLVHETQGLRDPTGRFAVARAVSPAPGLRLVDLKTGRVAWTIDPSPSNRVEYHSQFAFTSDGKRLAICSPGGGDILDLETDRLTPAPWLKGTTPAFSPDGRLIYVVVAIARDDEPLPSRDATRSALPPRREASMCEVRAYDLEGKVVKSYPLQMNVLGALTISKDGKTLTAEGGVGANMGSITGGTFSPGRQTDARQAGATPPRASAWSWNRCGSRRSFACARRPPARPWWTSRPLPIPTGSCTCPRGSGRVPPRPSTW